MTSREARRKLTAVVGVVSLAIVSAPDNTHSQPGLMTAADRQRQVLEAIHEEESGNGPFAEGLIGPLTALAILFHEERDQFQAEATIKRVLQLMRVNYGLHSLAQAPLIQQLIEHEEARGRAASAWELEQELLTLARRHPDDLRTVAIFREAAEKRKDVLDRYLDGESPPQIELGCYYDWPGTKPGDDGIPGQDMTQCSSGSRTDVQIALNADAQRHFAEAVSVLLRNDATQGDALRELEMELVRTASRTPQDPNLHRGDIMFEPWRSWAEALIGIANWDPADPDRNKRLAQNAMGAQAAFPTQYGVGRSALQRLYAREVATGSWQTQSEALVQIADWDLVHRRYAPALSQYELLYRKLKEMGAAQSSIDEIFSPATPAVLPTFMPNALISNETEGSGEYVDVAFEITRFGTSRKIEILDSSPGVSDRAHDRLVDLIRRSQFRPRTTDGRFRRSSSVVTRYYPGNVNEEPAP